MNSNTLKQTHAEPESALTSHNRGKEPPAAWREFIAGMEFLRRYGRHNTANSSAIGRDNLRLLHRALLQDAGYRQQVRNARHQLVQLACPTRIPLTSSHDLQAHLVSIPSENRIRLHAHPGHLGMFMILSGSAITSSLAETPSCGRIHWWPRRWHLCDRTRVKTHHLKADDVICVTHNESGADFLFGGKKGTVLLAVSTSLQSIHSHPTDSIDRTQAPQTPLHTPV